MAGVELVVDPAGDVGQGELPSSAASTEWNTTWKSRSPSSSSSASKPVPACFVDLVEGLEHLVGLLEEVAGEAGVGLLAVPRALGPQRADELVEAGDLAGDRLGEHRDPQRREVVGLDGAVSSSQATCAPTRRAAPGAGARRPRDRRRGRA